MPSANIFQVMDFAHVLWRRQAVAAAPLAYNLPLSGETLVSGDGCTRTLGCYNELQI